MSTPDRNSEAGNHSPSKTDSPQHAAKGHPLSTDSNHPNGSSPTGQVNQQTIQDIRKARIDAENADAKNRQEVIRLIIDALRAWHIYRLALVRSLGTHEIYYGVREDLDVFSFNGVKGSFNEEGMPDWAPWLESGFFVGSLMYIPLIALGYYDTPKTEFERARRVFEILDAAVWTLINFSRYNGAGASGVTTTILNLGIGAMLSLILLSLGYFFDLVNQCYFDYKNKQEQERFKKIEENKIENLKIIQEKFSEKNPKLALKFLEKYNNTFYGAEKNVTDLTNLQKTLAANPTTAATAIEAVYKKIISAENIASASDECKTIALDLKAKRENITQTLLALDIRETLQNNISKLTQLKAKLASNPETSIEIIKKDFEGIISATDESKSYSESIKIMKELETLDDKQGNKEIVTYKEKIDALQKVIATEIIENKQIIKNTFDNFAYAKKIAELQEIIKLELENFERAKEDNRVAVASVVADECRRTETEIKAQRQKIIEEIAALGEITPQNQEKYNEKIQKLKALIALEIQNHEKFTKELQSKIDYFYNWSLKWNIAYALFLFSGAIIALAVGSLLLLGSAFIAGATLVNQTKNLIQAYIDCENTIASCNKKEQFLNKLLETPSIAAINVMLEKNGLPKIAEKQTLDQYIATQRHHHRNDKQKLAILNQLPSNENLINHGFAPMAEGQNFAQYVHEQRTAIKCDRAAALKKYDLHKKWYAFVILTMVIMLACPWPLIALSIFLTCFLSYTAYKSYNHKHTWEADPDKISCTTTASLLKKYRDEINGHTDNLTKVDPAQGNPFLNGSATSSRMITSPTGIITKPAQTVAVPQNSVVSAGKLTNAGLELDQNGRLCPRLATIN